MPLSELVRKFNLKQSNIKNLNFVQQMEYAQWAWMELFRKSIWQLTTVVLEVDHRHEIHLPNNIERLINISVVDQYGHQQPLTYNPNLSTVELKCQKSKCSCSNCDGTDTLCGSLDAITATQETIYINDVAYTQVTHIRNSGCGTLQKEVDTYAWDAAAQEVVPVKNIETICDIEVTDRGCIKPTAPNIQVLQTYCGQNATVWGPYQNATYVGWYNPYRSLIPTAYNFYGYWNWNAENRNIIKIFRTAINPYCKDVYVNDGVENNPGICNGQENAIKKVIISYMTNGLSEDGSEVLVPAYAEMAMNAGMIYQQKFFNPRASASDKEYHRVAFRREKRYVEAYLNPIRMDDLRKMQALLRPW